MKRLIFTSALLCLVLAILGIGISESSKAYAQTKKAGKEWIKLDFFKGERIDGLVLSHAFDVEVTQGTNTGVTVEIDSRYREYLLCELNNGRLRLGYSDQLSKNRELNTISYRAKATVTVNSLDELSLAGSVHAACKGEFTGNALTVRSAGSGLINGLSYGTTGDISIALSGSGRIAMTIRGAEDVEVNRSGSGHIELDFKGPITSLSTKGSGSGVVRMKGVAAKKVFAELSGSGSVDLDGKTQSLKARGSGSGRVSAENLMASKVSAILSGSGRISVWATEELDASVSGSGNVVYKGSPALLNKTTSGSGKVKPL